MVGITVTMEHAGMTRLLAHGLAIVTGLALATGVAVYVYGGR